MITRRKKTNKRENQKPNKRTPLSARARHTKNTSHCLILRERNHLRVYYTNVTCSRLIFSLIYFAFSAPDGLDKFINFLSKTGRNRRKKMLIKRDNCHSTYKCVCTLERGMDCVFVLVCVHICVVGGEGGGGMRVRVHVCVCLRARARVCVQVYVRVHVRMPYHITNPHTQNQHTQRDSTSQRNKPRSKTRGRRGGGHQREAISIKPVWNGHDPGRGCKNKTIWN